MAAFNDRVRENIRQNEGGFVDDPEDHGGRTNHGITQDTLNAYCLEANIQSMDVKDLDWLRAFLCYEMFFWNRYRANLIENQTLAENYFDCLINSGPHTAGILLQQAAGMPEPHDGIVGSGTIASVNAAPAADVNAALVDLRKATYRAIVESHPDQEKFLNGWLARADRFLMEAA